MPLPREGEGEFEVMMAPSPRPYAPVYRRSCARCTGQGGYASICYFPLAMTGAQLGSCLALTQAPSTRISPVAYASTSNRYGAWHRARKIDRGRTEGPRHKQRLKFLHFFP